MIILIFSLNYYDDNSYFQLNFTRDHKDEIKKYGMFSKYEDSQEYLTSHLHLVCEETANYLVLWCIDLEIEEVSEKNQKMWKLQNLRYLV